MARTTLNRCINLAIPADFKVYVLSFALGVARGSGWQKIGAYINLGSFYLVGLPVAALLGFVAHLRGKGLWIGILVGSFMQSVLLSIVTACTDWNKQVLCPNSVFFPSTSLPCTCMFSCVVLLEAPIKCNDIFMTMCAYRLQRQGKGYLREDLQ